MKTKKPPNKPLIVKKTMIDLRDVEYVEILKQNNTIWVNVDGICRLRIVNFKFYARDKDDLQDDLQTRSYSAPS